MPYLFYRIVFLLASLFLGCNATVAQQPLVDHTNDYIITKRLLTVENGLPGRSVINTVQDKDGFMWFGTENGLSRYDGKKFTNFTKENSGLPENEIIKLMLDDSNRLVIFSDDRLTSDPATISLMDLKTYTISTPKNQSQFSVLKPTSKSAENENGNITYPNNSISLHLNNESIEIYSKEELANLPTLNFSGNYLDKYGNYWLCSSAGVFEISFKKNLFANYFNGNQPTELINKQVRNIYTASNFKDNNDQSDKIIYVCMGNKFFIQKNGLVKTVMTEKYFIFSLLKMSDKMYVGGSKLLVYDLQKQQLSEAPNLIENEIWTLFPASPFAIYAGTGQGISWYNVTTQKSEKLKVSNRNFPLPNIVYRFVQTINHGLIAVAQNGLFQIKNNTIVDYYGPAASATDHHLPISMIYDMYEDKQGVCWIASNGNGLYRWNWDAPNKKNVLQNFTTEAGLPSNILCRIEEDDANNLWVSTYNGLFSFNKTNQLVYSFSTADGITNNEFNRVSSFKGPDGRMYFGTVNGLTCFYPAEVLQQSIIKPVPFQVTMINKYSVVKDDFEPCINAYKMNNKIVIHPGEGLLTIEFSLLDFQERVHFHQYIIEGLPGKWKMGEGNTININNLPYGEFNLKIQAKLANGQWNPKEIEIAIVVERPVYLKPWFIILGIVLFVALLKWYFSSKTKKLLKNKITLESLVQSRTISLSKALQDKDLLIKEVHHRVKNNLQVIISLLHLQNEKITDQNLKLTIQESQSRIGSIALIHQNLYQHDQLDGIRFDEFVVNLIKQLNDFYKNLHHEIVLETNIVDTCIDIDTAVPLGLILNELFSNTYKHAFAHTSIIKVTVTMKEITNGEYQLVFHDNGPGLSDESVFLNAQTLGLELIRGLAKQLHGEAIYTYKEGSEFTIFFKDSITRKNT